MQRPCFSNQTMAPASGKRLRTRDDMRTAQDSSEHLGLTRAQPLTTPLKYWETKAHSIRASIVSVLAKMPAARANAHTRLACTKLTLIWARTSAWMNSRS
jgi:hypothetical protein